jgi:hypothetical protein
LVGCTYVLFAGYTFAIGVGYFCFIGRMLVLLAGCFYSYSESDDENYEPSVDDNLSGDDDYDWSDEESTSSRRKPSRTVSNCYHTLLKRTFYRVDRSHYSRL